MHAIQPQRQEVEETKHFNWVFYDRTIANEQ